MENNLATAIILHEDKSFAQTIENWLYNLEIRNIIKVNKYESAIHSIECYKPSFIFIDGQIYIELISEIKKLAPESMIVLFSENYKIDKIATAIQDGIDYILDKNSVSFYQFAITLNILSNKINTNDLFLNKSIEHKETIDLVIVEDDKIFETFLKWAISKLDQFVNVVFLNNGKDLVQYLKNHQIKNIYLDYYLPDIKCEVMINHLKSKFPHINITIISGQTNSNTAINLKALGIDNYLIKGMTIRDTLKKSLQKLH